MGELRAGIFINNPGQKTDTSVDASFFKKGGVKYGILRVWKSNHLYYVARKVCLQIRRYQRTSIRCLFILVNGIAKINLLYLICR